MVHVPRQPQTKAMAAGAAFDACVKAYMLKDRDINGAIEDCNVKLAGRKVKYGSDYNPVTLDTTKSNHMNMYECLLAENVELQNIPYARDVGKRIFIDYRTCGALDNILDDALELQPVDELTIEIKGGLVLLGKPDLIYRSKRYNEKVVDDWKVNGYTSARSVSPTPGYVDMFPSRAMHKKCVLEPGSGMSVNTLDIPSVYKLQLTVYSLLANADVVGISQLVFDKDGLLRVAKHRYRVSDTDINVMLRDAWIIWDLVQGWSLGEPFGELTADRCVQLMKQGIVLRDPLVAAMSGRGM
jgi:hypothetical protein